jgi:hypothetical protein
VFVGVINLGVALAFGDEKADFFQALEFALNVPGVLFDELGEASYVGLEIRVLSIYHNDFSPNS